jgi:hypothetical protein
VAALGLFITWLRHAGPQSSGVEVVVVGKCWLVRALLTSR